MWYFQALMRPLILASLIAAGGMAIASEAAAVDPNGHCTTGEATSFQQVGWLGYGLHEVLGINSQFVETKNRCQFRLYAGVFEKPVYFCEHDSFVGGIFEFTFHEAFGVSREEGVEDILKFTVNNTLKAQGSDDPIAAAALRVTPIKTTYNPEVGSLVIQHHSYAIKLPVGTYQNSFQEIYLGGLWGEPYDESVTTEVIILPHEIAHSYDLGYHPPD